MLSGLYAGGVWALYRWCLGFFDKEIWALTCGIWAFYESMCIGILALYMWNLVFSQVVSGLFIKESGQFTGGI